MVLPSGAALVRSFVFNVLRLSDPDDLDEAVHAMQPGPAARHFLDATARDPGLEPPRRPNPCRSQRGVTGGPRDQHPRSGRLFHGWSGACSGPDLGRGSSRGPGSGRCDCSPTRGRARATRIPPTDGLRLHVLLAGSGREVSVTTVTTSPSGTRRCVMPRYQPDSAFPCLRPGGRTQPAHVRWRRTSKETRGPAHGAGLRHLCGRPTFQRRRRPDPAAPLAGGQPLRASRDPSRFDRGGCG